MADITRSSAASMDASTGMFAPQVTGSLYAGEALDAVAPCYIKASDGKVYMSDASAVDEVAKFDGFTPKAYRVGDAVTLFGMGARFRYGTGLTAGANYYISGTTGRLSDIPTTGCPIPVARAINTTDIRVLENSDRTPSFFVSAEQTGNGGAQSIAHGLAAVPRVVLVVPTDLTPATVGQYVVTEGTHTTTNVVVTVTTSKKYKVVAFL